MGQFSRDVCLTAYRKYLRIYEDALKAALGGRVPEASLTLARALLHAPQVLAAFRGEMVPTDGRLGEWLLGRMNFGFPGYEKAIAHGDLEGRFAGAREVTDTLDDLASPRSDQWETGRMRFGRGFRTEDLFFAQSGNRLLKIWDRSWDRGELLSGMRTFSAKVRDEDIRTGEEFESALVEAFTDCRQVQGIVLFGSNAENPLRSWHRSEGRDVDLAFIGRGLWFRRVVFASEEVILDVVRLPICVLERGVEKEDDFVHNALVGARIIRDDTGIISTLQDKVRANYHKGRTLPGEDEAERRRRAVDRWLLWGKNVNGSTLPQSWLRLETACRGILKEGCRLAGIWFPPDQNICSSISKWDSEAGSLLSEYARETDPSRAFEYLGRIASVFLKGGKRESNR